MNKNLSASRISRQTLLIGSSMAIAIALLFLIQLMTVGAGGAPDLSSSTKTVSPTSAQPGGTVSYEIVVTNDGTALAGNVTITDSLPAEVVSISNITDSATNGLGTIRLTPDNDVVWEGMLNTNGFVMITFDALLTDTLTAGVSVTNSVAITGSGELIEKTAVLTINEETNIFLPAVFKPLPAVSGVSASAADSDSDFTVSWSSLGINGVTGYEVQEATDPDFTNVVNTFTVGNVNSITIDGSPSRDNVRFVRVRATLGTDTSLWSNTAMVINNYREGFGNGQQNWNVRRTDAGSDFEIEWKDEGSLQFELLDSNDYVILSPLQPAPSIPYRIEARMSGRDLQDRHMYGIVFAADWDGSTCPNNDYSSCFTSFYELRVQYRELSGREFFEFKLKRITNVDDNQPDGETLIDWIEVDIDDDEKNDYFEWQIDVEADGDIKIYVDDNRFGSVRDSDVLSSNTNGYFGVVGITKENSDSKARVEEFKVTILEAGLLTID